MNLSQLIKHEHNQRKWITHSKN